MLHRLRQSASRTGRLLLPLLLLSWLSVFCGNCVAMVDMADHAVHNMPMPQAGHGDHLEHDCCDQPEPCLGGTCDHLQDTPALTVEAKSEPLPAPVLMALLPSVPALPSLRAGNAFLAPDTEAVATLARPLYLQHCVFLI